MRVAVFAHRLAAQHPTGIGRYIRELVGALHRVAGGDGVIVSSTPETRPAGWLPAGVTVRPVPWPRRPVQLAWCLGLGPRLERALGKLDVCHLVQPFPPAPTTAPQVVTLHDLFPLEHPEWYPPSERWSHRRSIALVARRASRIVVPSVYVSERLIDSLAVDPSLVEVVPLGVSGAFGADASQEEVAAVCARFGVPPGGFAVSVGAVSTRKNVITLVRALSHLPSPGLPLVLVGPAGHGASDVDAEIARLDGRASVVRTGYLPDADTAALVRGAAVLVHPALSEGFGFVPLEAMAAGTPVIAARVSALPEVVGEAALLVDEPAEPAAWAQALLTVTEDEDRRRALSRAGTERAAQFSWDRTARQMMDIYRSVAGG